MEETKKNSTENTGKLYIVPTPIGNLKDITFRAIEVLQSVDLIFSEDTRVTLKLLNHFGIKKKLFSYHKDNETSSASKLISFLIQGRNIALTSDAGTPCISDPGQILVKKLIDQNISFEVLPGPVAFIPAVIKSGFRTDKIFFSGFLPASAKERKAHLEYLKNNVTATIVFYESPHRISKTIEELLGIFSPPISVSRELTKIYETTYTINELSEISNIISKGEFVIVIDNNYEKSMDIDVKIVIDKLEMEGFKGKEIIKVLKALGVKRNKAYELVEKLEKQ